MWTLEVSIPLPPACEAGALPSELNAQIKRRCQPLPNTNQSPTTNLQKMNQSYTTLQRTFFLHVACLVLSHYAHSLYHCQPLTIGTSRLPRSHHGNSYSNTPPPPHAISMPMSRKMFHHERNIPQDHKTTRFQHY